MIWYRHLVVSLLLCFAPGFADTAIALEIGDGADSIGAAERWWQAFPELVARSQAERRLLADMADGVLDDTTLIRAALISSGVTQDRQLADCEARFDAFGDSLAASVPANAGVRRRAQLILTFMHESVLVDRYDATTTRLDVALDQGRFNCVSSAILYRCFAERIDLDVRAVELPGHVRCEVHGEAETFVVEPTCAGWFAVMNSRAEGDRLVRQTTGYRSGQPATARRISPVQLLAMVYYNDGIELLKTDQLDVAVRSNLNAFALDSTSDIIQGNLLAAVNNWALVLAKDQKFSESASLLERGLRLAPRYKHFLQNDIHVHQHWMDELWRTGCYDEAQRRLKRAMQRRPDVEYFNLARFEGFRREAVANLEKGDLAGALDVFEVARMCDHQPWRDIEAGLLSDHALQSAREDDFEAAIQCFDLGLERLPDNALLVRNRHTTVSHWVAGAYQRHDYSEGLRRCRFSSGPTSPSTTMPDDLRYGYHHWIRTLVEEGREADARTALREAASMLPNDNLWQQWQATLDR